MNAYVKVLAVLLLFATSAQSGVVDDFINQKDVMVFVSKDKKFHEESCPDRPKAGTRMHFADVMESPELFPADCIDSPKYQEVYKTWIQLRTPEMEQKHIARTKLLKIFTDDTKPLPKAKQSSIRFAYQSYVTSSNKIGLRYDDTALSELLKIGLEKEDEEGDATPEQKAKLKRLLESATQRCHRNTDLPVDHILLRLMIIGLTENVEREAKTIKALKERVQ